MSFIFTSESVSEGHPDKVCDRISDTVLDLFLSHDPEARVACESLATTNLVVLAGEVRAENDKIETIMSEIEPAVREAIREIGYDQEAFHHEKLSLKNYLHGQSTDIAMGVDSAENKKEGAGDQGLMFGYACGETDVMMPAPIHYSHQILKNLARVRKSDTNSILGPDSKSQVSLIYSNDGDPIGVHKIVLSTQHKEGVKQDQIRDIVHPILKDVLPTDWIVEDEKLLINPTGQFVTGGPDGDTGLTGRKIIVDTYGGSALHGGGAFSGKDPTKVDRSAAYACRYLAKNVVAAQIAKKCTIQIAYAIGVAEPVSLYVNTHGTGVVEDKKIEQTLITIMDLTPSGIREHLGLNAPIYAPTSAYGHFGRGFDEAGPGTFSWEKTDIVSDIKSFLT